MPAAEVQVPELPYYEVIAHTRGEPGPAALTLYTPHEEPAREIARDWARRFDVLASRVDEDGRELIYPPRGEGAG